MVKTVDNRGLPCPQPVLNTKRALEDIKDSSDEFVLVSIVDNEGAKENILRLLNNMGNLATEVEKKDDGIYVQIKKSLSTAEAQNTPGEDNEQPLSCLCDEGQAPVILITRSILGGGSEELGKILMRSFVSTIKDSPVLPEKIMFLNSGVYLTVSGSPVLDELRELEQLGVEIFSCGTCLDYFQLKEKLAVGSITNMFATVETLLTCTRCVTI